MKRLVINADDFGFTRDVNAGIIEAQRTGVLTATTLMANGEAFEDAVRLARATPTLDIGCHLVLVQGRSLVNGRPLPENPARLATELLRRRIDIRAELRAQIEKTIAAGIRPTHLDSHKHTHLLPNVFREVVRLAQEFGIGYVRLPIMAIAGRAYRRYADCRGVHMTDHFLGFRLTGSLNEQTLAEAIERLPDGTTEFMCHPGYLGPELAGASTRLKQSRVSELEALTSPRIREIISSRQIELRNFAALTDN